MYRFTQVEFFDWSQTKIMKFIYLNYGKTVLRNYQEMIILCVCFYWLMLRAVCFRCFQRRMPRVIWYKRRANTRLWIPVSVHIASPRRPYGSATLRLGGCEERTFAGMTKPLMDSGCFALLLSECRDENKRKRESPVLRKTPASITF